MLSQSCPTLFEAYAERTPQTLRLSCVPGASSAAVLFAVFEAYAKRTPIFVLWHCAVLSSHGMCFQLSCLTRFEAYAERTQHMFCLRRASGASRGTFRFVVFEAYAKRAPLVVLGRCAVLSLHGMSF